MRQWGVFVLVGASWSCGDNCETRVAALEARLSDQMAQMAVLRRIDYRLEDQRVDVEQRHAILPRATKPERHFAPGMAFRVSTDEHARAAFETAVADLACEKREGPLRLYLVASSEQDVGAYASWLSAASVAWKVPIEARRVVRLEAVEDVFPWPPNSEVGQELAKEVFATKDEPDRERMIEAMRLSTIGCPAIIEEAGAYSGSVGGEPAFILPRGLRECGCRVFDMDTTVGVWHVAELARTDVRWEPIAAPPSTAPVPPLACGAPKPPTVLLRRDAWTTTPPDLNDMLIRALEWVDDCRRRAPRDTAEMIRLSVSHSSTFARYEMSAHDDAGMFLGGCSSQTLQETARKDELGDESLDGSTALDVYVPAGPGSDVVE